MKKIILALMVMLALFSGFSPSVRGHDGDDDDDHHDGCVFYWWDDDDDHHDHDHQTTNTKKGKTGQNFFSSK